MRRRPPTAGATYSVVTPLYNVAPYLPEFFASLQRQTVGFERLQVILVDDGSDDGRTPRLAKEFADRNAANVVFLSKPNGGQASARNMGLAHATGEWVTFPDPDDVLRPTYFAECEAALARHPHERVDVVSTRIRLWYGRGRGDDTHALDGRFRHGVVLRHLDVQADWIQPHVTSALIRRSVVEENGIRFPEQLRLRFEDGAFISEYLLHIDDPTVLFVPGAEYLYRQRQDSTIQVGKADPRKYVDHLRHGFLPLIEIAERRHGAVPRWLQNLFLYDQFWILRASQAGEARRVMFSDRMQVALSELISTYLTHIDDDAIDDFALMPIEPWMRDALLIAKGSTVHGAVAAAEHDPRRGLRAYTYTHGGDPVPSERVLGDDREIEPRFTKEQALEYAGRAIAWQRTLWLPDDVDVRIEIDGTPQTLRTPERRARDAYGVDAAAAATTWHARRARLKRVGARETIARGKRFLRRGVDMARGELARRSARAARTFGHAWVFIDRDVDAADSAEDMYFWVRENHPEVNAWFVIRRDSRDWQRLAARGARLVAYGTGRHLALMAHADNLVSSHADRFITASVPRRLRSGYAFTFLQHGVIKGDISEWLNKKDIDAFITSTEEEYDYITGSSPYVFGAKEVRLTGLPRHDVLLQLQRARGDSPRRTVLIMPTWRDYLVGDMTSTSSARERVGAFMRSRYAQCWQDLLNSPRIAELAAAGHDVVFMPHPNMRAHLGDFRVPAHVQRASYADADMRALLVDAAALVTDYSSTAFNAAYLQIPVVYYQFDADEYRSGHTERDGYFRYDEHGFGPVCVEADTAAAALVRVVESGAAPEYRERMRRAFPQRDGRNRERVFAAMIEIRTRRPLDERVTAAPPDRWNPSGTA
ncbi:CDP-glycerol glycerophosphotransferase family protein [Microbacterium sp. SYP-A9085]|uniref:bifunctional glycosyltransferase/CDP-glycerol:glycerophosphate glycerophosphotransferase n=1 Tax=Microbacterium sp. SYP-A9085 TaxID=2664454 RepID=UPI001561BFCE|nr:CDP-glycerol glycerophosphotransferase family protein [Microbacterium sp. SYP-A9085]